jgi:ankyrin repeat protein
MRYIKPYNIFESENFNAEREMSDFLGYDVKFFHEVNKLLFLNQKEIQEWFEDEMEKEEPNWDLVEILQSQHDIKFDYKNLHWAAEHNNIGLAKYWLDKGVDKDTEDITLDTPLHWAAIYDSEAVAKLLLDAGANKDAQNENLRTPLHFASTYNKSEIAKLLLDAGANKDAQDKWKQTPLHLTAIQNSGAVAKLLIDAGADKDARNENLNTPLHSAALNDSEAVAKLLIDAGADKEAINKYLRTPLHYAAIINSEAVAKLLIDAGADKGAKNKDDLTPWDLAGSEIRQSLPELNPDVKQFESENFNAEREMSDFLGYDVKLFNQVNKLLFLSKEELEEWFYNEMGKEEPRWDLIEVLQSQHGANFEYKDIHWAVEHDKVGLAKYWLDRGIDKDAKDKNLKTPLHQAAIYNSEAIAKLLIDAGADKEAREEWLLTPLHFAAEFNREAIAKLLIDAGADKDARNKYLWTPLHYAAYENSERVAKLLIDAGADKEAQSNILSTPLHLTAKYNNEAVAQILIDAGADKDAKDDDLQTPLHWAVIFDSEAVAKLLIDAGVDKDAKDNESNTSWDLADSKLRQSLPELNPDVKQFESENFDAEREMSDILGYDVKLMPEVNKFSFMSDREIESWFSNQIESDNPDIHLIDALVKTGYKFEELDNNLIWAIQRDEIGLLKILIHMGADKNVQDEDFRTPLHWAVYKNNIEAVWILLEIGAEIDNANNPHKQTPLIIATIYQRLEIIKLL